MNESVYKGIKRALNVLYLMWFMFAIPVKTPAYSPVCGHSCSVAPFGLISFLGESYLELVSANDVRMPKCEICP